MASESTELKCFSGGWLLAMPSCLQPSQRARGQHVPEPGLEKQRNASLERTEGGQTSLELMKFSGSRRQAIERTGAATTILESGKGSNPVDLRNENTGSDPAANFGDFARLGLTAGGLSSR